MAHIMQGNLQEVNKVHIEGKLGLFKGRNEKVMINMTVVVDHGSRGQGVA